MKFNNLKIKVKRICFIGFVIIVSPMKASSVEPVDGYIPPTVITRPNPRQHESPMAIFGGRRPKPKTNPGDNKNKCVAFDVNTPYTARENFVGPFSGLANKTRSNPSTDKALDGLIKRANLITIKNNQGAVKMAGIEVFYLSTYGA
jgi:hypothetical protein